MNGRELWRRFARDRWVINLYYGVAYCFGVPIPLLDIEIERIEDDRR